MIPSNEAINAAIAAIPDPEPLALPTEQPAAQPEGGTPDAVRKEEGEGQEAQKQVKPDATGGEEKPPAETEKPAEPKVSARERLSKRDEFEQKAQAEAEVRRRETEIRAREQALKEEQAKYAEWQKDPYGYLAKTDPSGLRDWIRTMAEKGEQPELIAQKHVETELEKLRREQKEAMDNLKRQQAQDNEARFYHEVDRSMSVEAAKDAHMYAKLHRALTGVEVDRNAQAASIFTEYATQYGKYLTPGQVAEIIIDDDTARLEAARKDPELIDFFGGSKSTQSQSGSTPENSGTNGDRPKQISNDMATGGAIPTPADLSKLTKDQRIAYLASTWTPEE